MCTDSSPDPPNLGNGVVFRSTKPDLGHRTDYHFHPSFCDSDHCGNHSIQEAQEPSAPIIKKQAQTLLVPVKFVPV